MSSTPGPYLVVGLGNPGPKYANTRHNIGVMVLDEVAARIGSSFRRRGNADVLVGRLASAQVLLARARTYMNESGPPIAAVLRFHKVPIDALVVVHDELDLPFGSLRAKLGGGDNGHNGLRSLTRALGGPDYLRVRVGIGRPPAGSRQEPADYVLSDFTAGQRRELVTLVPHAADAVESLLQVGLGATQNRFHGAGTDRQPDSA